MHVMTQLHTTQEHSWIMSSFDFAFTYEAPDAPADVDPAIIITTFLDPVCPFSIKSFRMLPQVVQAYKGRVAWRFYLQTQPWHPQAGYLSQAVCLVYTLAGRGRSGSAAGIRLLASIMDDRDALFTDAKVEECTPKQLRDLLAQKAAGIVEGVDKAAFLAHWSGPAYHDAYEGGEAAQRLFKNHTKLSRAWGVHVTPTVYVNGLVANEPSSGWTLEQWQAFVDPLLKPSAL